MNRLLLLVFLLSTLTASSQCVNTINTFPYNESFENGTANWFSGGTNNDWAWGSPAKPVINSAGAGIYCWVTGGTIASFYNLGERSWVQSPCFDFTNVDKPYVSFLVFWETERQYDGGNFQYSTNGITWTTIGSVNATDTCSTQNWYNISSITNLNGIGGSSQGWSGTIQQSSGPCSGGGGSAEWKRASHCLEFLAHMPEVRFRFTFGSGTTCNDYDGLAFDDIYIGEGPVIPADIKLTCLSDNRIAFEDIYRSCHATWNWNFGDTGSAANTSSSALTEHTFSQGGTFNVTLGVTGGCSPDMQVSKQVIIPSYSTQVTDVTCAGLNNGSAQVMVTNTTPAVTYSWSHDPAITTSMATGLPAGQYIVLVSDSFCPVEVALTVGYDALAEPFVTLGDDTTICPGSFILLRPGRYSSYQWQDNSTDSFYVVRSNGIYTVNVRNSAGCLATDSIVILEDCMNDIIVPNAFSPNGDGLNEVFFVNGSFTTAFEIFIFNRWGEMIFKSPDRNIGWDGSARGQPVQEGFYNYLINYSLGKEELVKSGSVLVIR